MEDRSANDEVSLRDLYLVLRRWWLFVVGCAIGAALVTLGVSLVLPKKFQSKGTYSLSLSTEKQAAPLTNLPLLAGLAQGYVDSLRTTAFAQELGEADPGQVFSATFDDKRDLWVLTGTGETPQLARQRADRLMKSSSAHLENQVVSAVRSGTEGALEQTRLDLAITEQSLARVDAALASTPQISNRDGATAAALEAQGISPQISRSTNPAFVTLAVQQSQLKAQRALYQARIQTYTELLKDPVRLKALARQAFSIQLIAAPSEPLDPKSPQPVLYGLIAGFVGLFLGLLLPFVFEAVRAPEASGNLTQREFPSAAD